MSSSRQQQRRARERARERTAARSAHAAGRTRGPGAAPDAGPARPPSLEEQVVAALSAGLQRLQAGDAAGFAVAADVLAEGDGTPAWQRAAERLLTRALTVSTLPHLWQAGWEPADLVRVVRRRLDQVHADLVGSAVASELAGYARDTVDPRWMRQLEALDATVWAPADSTLLAATSGGDPDLWTTVVRIALQVIDVITHLPTLQALSRPPGTGHTFPAVGGAPERAVDERILQRVRALLAKAESTTYPAEAETFTSGAQALMARYSIDRALLESAGRRPSDGPGGRRLGIDNPYEGPKTMLLDAVARANRCRTVWSKELGFCTVIGFPGDLDAVELLFTSLLVQATTAMTQAGAKKDAIGRSRTRSFRQSFLISYAHRIGERLAEATAVQTEAAAAEPGGARLLPVLAARHEEVDQAVSGLFPQLREASVGGVHDREGWTSGRAAADLASLQAAQEVGS